MAFRMVDPRFPSLTYYCLSFYWIVCLVTLGITVGSVARQVGVYRSNCSTQIPYYGTNYTDPYADPYGDYNATTPDLWQPEYITECHAGDIVVFALGLGVAFIAMILSSLQLLLFTRNRISPLRLFCFCAPVVVLWIVVIAIGWNPTNYTYDASTDLYTPNISGWLYNYSGYWYQDSIQYGVGATLALAMGFAVMSIVSFGIVTLLALYAFIVHHRNSRKQRRADSEALVTVPILSEKKNSASNPVITDPLALPQGSSVLPSQVAPHVALPEPTQGRPLSRRSI